MKKDDMRKYTCCFSGHRRIPNEDLFIVKQKLMKAISSAIKDGYIYFGAGGALGFDTLAAQTVLEMKKQYAQIRLILVLPCLSQARYWREQDISEYERIKRSADKVIYTSQEYTYDCMHKRNRHLVNNSSLCICYLKEQSGGTAYTVNYAESRGLNIINVSL